MKQVPLCSHFKVEEIDLWLSKFKKNPTVDVWEKQGLNLGLCHSKAPDSQWLTWEILV